MIKIKKQIWKRLALTFFIGMNLFFLTQCTSEKMANLEKEKTTKSLKSNNASKRVVPNINYHLISTKDSSIWLHSLKAGDTLHTLLVLNRVDHKNLFRLDTLVVPDSFGQGIEVYSPFPQSISELQSVHKILYVSHYAQAFAVYEKGELIKWGPASLGKKSTPTPTGLFFTNWKAKKTISTVDPSWIMEWYFNLANFEGVSMHQYALPGYPASHACIRLSRDDAYWLYHWADQWILDQSKISIYGTPVIIFGSYPFGQRKPWFLLSTNSKALTISENEIIKVTDEFLPTIMDRQAKRDSIEVK